MTNANVQRLREIVGWTAEPTPVDWAPIEAAIGISLPPEFRELCEAFPHGEYQHYVHLIHPARYASVQEHASELLGYADLLRGEPYRQPSDVRMYPEPGGLIPWAHLGFSPLLCWRPVGDDPDRWPTYVCDPGGPLWLSYDLSPAAFLVALATDPTVVAELDYVTRAVQPPAFDPLRSNR